MKYQQGMAFQPSYPPGASGSSDPTHPAGVSSMLPYMNPWIPCSMPWTMENPPQLVRFGEQPTSVLENWGIPRPKLRYHKRKSNLDFNPKPVKMHITEEKMAAQLKNMHISNNYVGDQGFGDAMGKNDCLLPTLKLSKEVQSLTQSFQEPLLPESLLPKLDRERSTRALVLWKPPAGSITSQIISNLRSSEEEEGDNINNNSSTPDLNSMTTAGSGFSSSSTDMELS